MSNRIFSFSVKPKDKVASKLLDEVQKISIKKGIKFSYMVIEGLKLYMAQEKANGQ